MGRISDLFKKLFGRKESYIETDNPPTKKVRVTLELISVFNEILSKNNITDYFIVEHTDSIIDTADFFFKNEKDAELASLLKFDAIITYNEKKYSQSSERLLPSVEKREMGLQSTSICFADKDKYIPFKHKDEISSLDSVIAQCSKIAAEQNKYMPLHSRTQDSRQI